MKNKYFILFLILSAINIVSVAQSQTKYEQANLDKTDNYPQDIYQDKDGNIYVLFLNKMNLTKNQGVSLNKFSPSLNFLSRIDIKGDLPDFFQARIVLDYVCIIALNVMGQNSNLNNVMFYDFSGNFIKKIEFDPTYNYSKIFGGGGPGFSANLAFIENYTNFTCSKDKKKYLIWGVKTSKAPNNKIGISHDIKVYAFNLDLVKIAEETFRFEDVFSNTLDFNSFSFDITPNNKIICFSTNKPLPDQAQLSIAIFNDPENKPTVHNYSFKYDDIVFAYNFGNLDEIFINGVVNLGAPRITLKSNPDKSIFFINQSLISPETINPVVYDIEKEIYTSYPDQKDHLKRNPMVPLDVFVMDDGIICASTYIEEINTSEKTYNYANYYANEKTYYYANSLIFSKFSFSGKIQWLKTVNKRVHIDRQLTPINYLYYEKEGGLLKFIYPDFNDNINDGTKIFHNSDDPKVLAVSEVSSAGVISTKLFEKNDEMEFKFLLTKSVFNNNRIISLAISQPNLQKKTCYLVEIKYP